MKNVVLIEKMMEAVPNKYEAIRVVAKEARRINALLIRGAQGEVDDKPTMMAMRRLLDNKVKFDYADAVREQPLFEEEAE